MNVTDISCGYDRMNGQRLGQVEATFQTGRNILASPFFFSHTKKLLMQDADARNAAGNTGAGTLIIPDASIPLLWPFYVRDYVSHNNFSDATDMNGDYLLNSYRRGQLKNGQKETPAQVSPSVSLIPRLTQNDNKLSVSFLKWELPKCSW